MEPHGSERQRWITPRSRSERERVSQSVPVADSSLYFLRSSRTARELAACSSTSVTFALFVVGCAVFSFFSGLPRKRSAVDSTPIGIWWLQILPARCETAYA